MKKFHYHNIEKKNHNGKHITRKVYIKNGKGYKSITMQKGGKRHTVKRTLKTDEIHKIRKGKFINGLFQNCKNKY